MLGSWLCIEGMIFKLESSLASHTAMILPEGEVHVSYWVKNYMQNVLVQLKGVFISKKFTLFTPVTKVLS